MSTSHTVAKTPAARCLLKWLSTQIHNPKVTEALKDRVTKIRCEGDGDRFGMVLEVNGEYARKILEMKRVSILDCLRQGYMDQGDLNLDAISFEVVK